MDGQYFQKNGQRGNHFGSTVVYSKPLIHNPMPASHNYIRNGTTERAKGYDAWVSSRENDESYIRNECNKKDLGPGEATEGYPNMRQAPREEDNMIVKSPAFIEDEYDHDHEKVFAAHEATQEYIDMRQEAVREKDDDMFAKNQIFSKGDQYSNKTYSPEVGRGYMNSQKVARQKEDLSASRPVYGDDQYSHQMYSTEAGRGHMNFRQAARTEEEPMYALNPVLSDNEYGHKMYSADGGRGYMHVRQAPRRMEDSMFALNFSMFAFNPILSDDDYDYKVYSTPAVLPVQDYANMRHGIKEDSIFLSSQAFGIADYRDKGYYKPSHMEPTSMRKAVACGPWGGNTGNLFDDGVFTGIREIQLTRSGGIVSIRVCYDMEGKAIWGNKNGGNHGMKVDKIILDYPSEYLTHISGYYGSTILWGPTVLKSLTFHTNKRNYGPFGNEQGISFFSAGPGEGKIVGFNGRIKNWYVESIGVHVMEVKTTRPAYAAFNMSGRRMRLEW